MPNIGTMLKQEISRLSRREVRSQVDATKKATTQHRRYIAALKRRITQLERHVDLLARKVLSTQRGIPAASTASRSRFVSKGLRSQRMRLGLSAADYGKLLGVSAQSIYSWERQRASPRNEQVARLAALRGIGKREAAERLKQMRSPGGATRRRR